MRGTTGYFGIDIFHSVIRIPSCLKTQWPIKLSSMDSSRADMGVRNPNNKKSLGFMANAIKHKHSFIQFFAMTGILLLSVRSLGQKYRLNDLHEDTSALKEEREGLVKRKNNIKRSLLEEASLDSTGAFSSKIRHLFGDNE